MSERLIKGLKTSQSEIQSGLAQTEEELAELRAKCRELEEILALGRVTQFAAQMVGGFPPATVPAPSQAPATQPQPPAPAPPDRARSVPKTNHEAAGAAGVNQEAPASLAERAAVLRAALDKK